MSGMYLRVWIDDEPKAIWEIHGTASNPIMQESMRMMQIAAERILEALVTRGKIKKFMVRTEIEYKEPSKKQ